MQTELEKPKAVLGFSRSSSAVCHTFNSPGFRLQSSKSWHQHSKTLRNCLNSTGWIQGRLISIRARVHLQLRSPSRGRSGPNWTLALGRKKKTQIGRIRYSESPFYMGFSCHMLHIRKNKPNRSRLNIRVNLAS